MLPAPNRRTADSCRRLSTTSSLQTQNLACPNLPRLDERSRRSERDGLNCLRSQRYALQAPSCPAPLSDDVVGTKTTSLITLKGPCFAMHASQHNHVLFIAMHPPLTPRSRRRRHPHRDLHPTRHFHHYHRPLS